MKQLSKFYGILLLVGLGLNVHAQKAKPSFTENDTSIIDLNRPYHGNIKPPEFPGAENGLAGYLIDKITYTQKEINNGAKGEVVIWIYIERDGTISKTRFDKNTYSAFGERVRSILLHAPKSIPGTRDGKPGRFKLKLNLTFEAHKVN